MKQILIRNILLILILCIGVFSLHDYLHASYDYGDSEDTGHQCGSTDNNQDSSCDCLCICDISLLNIDYVLDQEIAFLPTYIIIHQEITPTSPFLNPLIRPPQTV